MIDWFSLAANALWILACAIALATLSYASWIASLQHVKLRKILALPKFQTSINIAGVLFCLGLAGTSDKWWEIMFWLIIAALFIGQVAIKTINKKIA
jgi:hypothetical protein